MIVIIMRRVDKLSVGGELVLPQIASLAATPTTGSLSYYNVNNSLYFADGAVWKPVTTPDNLITVSSSGPADFTNIGDALTFAATLLPTPTAISVLPGTYMELNPLVVPSGVSILGSGGPLVSQVIALNTGSDLFVLGNGCIVENMVTVGSARAFVYDGSVGTASGSIVRGCIMTNPVVGVESINGPGELFCVENLVKSSTGVTTNAFISSSGGKMRCYTTGIFGIPGSEVTTGVASTGTGSFVIFFSGGMQYCDVGTLVDDDAELIIKSDYINFCDISAKVGSTGTSSIFRMSDATITNSITYDLDIAATDAHITIAGGTLQVNLINNPNTVEYHCFSFSGQLGDEALQVTGELHVGVYNHPSESAFGGGDSHVIGLKVLSLDSTGTNWIDYSVNAANLLTTFSPFQSTAVGNILYVGGTQEFPGLKVTMTSAWGSGDTANTVSEYWDGATWSPFLFMTIKRDSPYYSRADTIWEQNEVQQTRYGKMPGWASTTVNSITGFWIRIRVTSTLTGPLPVLNQIKLHSSRMEIKEDGYIQYYGNARNTTSLPWDLGLLEAATSSPSNQDLYISDRLNVGRQENLLANGVTDRLGFSTYLPAEIDTSFGIKLMWSFITSSTSGGSVDWVIRWGWTKDGDNVYTSTAAAPTTGPNEQSISFSTAITPSTPNIQKSEIQYITIPSVNAYPQTGNPDVLWVTLERDGGGDTHSGNIALSQFAGQYVRWTEGGHIDSF